MLKTPSLLGFRRVRPSLDNQSTKGASVGMVAFPDISTDVDSPVPKAHVLGIYCRRNSTSRTAGGRIPTQDAYAITTAVGTVLSSLSSPLPLTLRLFTDVSPECCSHRTNPRAIGTG
ncbi:hypothetical protein AVEN_190328-1 [Araneus ventricosus]|uniref:Uncharacterized protein n=1 Tax=Araneus ventricosus TaxID=182803 RepID=A0A4Y2GPT8_ARAVE|nr:hypothetical protein AVEN_190328-1 [Araneus ventricosus]